MTHYHHAPGPSSPPGPRHVPPQQLAGTPSGGIRIPPPEVRKLLLKSRYAGFSRVYSAVAVMFLVLAPFPLYEPQTVDGRLIEYRTFLEGATHTTATMLGFGMYLIFVAALVALSFQPLARAVPTLVAVMAVALAAVLLSKPSIVEPQKPDLTPAGLAGVILMFLTAGLGVAQELALWREAKRPTA
ncbi:hypothetical protein [Salininema proteolyticum]|uniref:Uncharacterized protein n=1 Tax=Salininema proteolyticum TaxID=1607685 RepID=A0ABV8U338_9ACTN